jgi:hypothetical protein
MGTAVEQAEQGFPMLHAGIDDQQRRGLRLAGREGEAIKRFLAKICGFAHAAFLFVCARSGTVGSFV